MASWHMAVQWPEPELGVSPALGFLESADYWKRVLSARPGHLSSVAEPASESVLSPGKELTTGYTAPQASTHAQSTEVGNHTAVHLFAMSRWYYT